MRQSSSPSDAGADLFDGVLAAGPVRAAVAGRAWLAALVEVEAALARVQGRLGVIPADAAEAVVGVCRTEILDPAAVSAASVAVGNPVEPVVRALRAALPADATGFVHKGATSQDVLDTAAMLISHRAVTLILADIRAAADRCADLAARHRDTATVGRTLLQHAAPTTFGLVAAGWMTGLDEAGRRLAQVRDTRLAVQLGGTVGTLAALGPPGPAVLDALAAELGLAAPVLPWHTDRTRIAELAGALGTVAAAVAKVARDVVLCSQTEVGELSDGTDRGGSSAMPHKRNPIAAVAAAAGAAQAPGLVATLLAGVPEHQRAAGAWHAEWRPLRALLESVGSAAHWLRDCLDTVRVHPDRMRANLDRTGAALFTELIAAALAPIHGATAAHDTIRAAVREATDGGRDLVDVIVDRTPLDRAQVAALAVVDPHVAAAGTLVDRALAAAREAREEPRP